jgi:hypothetical protein
MLKIQALLLLVVVGQDVLALAKSVVATTIFILVVVD